MASNRPAPEAPFIPASDEPETFGYGSYRAEEGPWEEWNPTEDSVTQVRGRHRVAKQRGGFARSSTVLGVGVMAAVGAGGMASAHTGKPPVSISLPDLDSVGHLFGGGSSTAPKSTGTGLSDVGVSTDSSKSGGAGEALRNRIMAQAEQQQSKADSKATAAAIAAADRQTADAAAKAEKDAAAKAAAAKDKAQADAKQAEEAKRLAELAKQYTLPVVSYTITGTFGQPGAMWSSGYHTGLDFAAPTGTLIKAIHGGTITQAGWAGAYGYRTVLTLDDGTELWFCHQSSINVSVGQKVSTGDVIGRIGATGNVTGPHLHLEVHPNGQASAVDPAPWLRGKGLNP
ncbi:M23 family metallopeptidase [Streptomyces broussonetiae]|uniref:Peptidoglycan DD-metalloendopeptidase family protein n=1 Tax=Streptomyces broussonetiae TaxID=2686304 RepID=A0A6I6N9H2_9ACTN|nr:M23 family metallopeptidase [Streptomyces broussonetiae]QHA05585.1 peptidoglycan DD-metalloendopeptidase family protein [Streptomyces broussonetiae]